MVNNFTTITLKKDLLEKLKEERKNFQQRSYGGLIEHLLVMQKNYLRLKKTKELMNMSPQDIDNAEEFFNKLNQMDEKMDEKIEFLTKKTSNSFNFILEKFNNLDERLDILEGKMRG
ncbi:MAG: hypothetical protein ABIA74_06070 [bacterium]